MNIKDLLIRTNLTTPFKEFLPSIQSMYPRIGTILSFEPIYEGYEDANFILKTETGSYVLKIFSKERSLKNIYDYAQVIIEATKVGVETLEIVTGKEGEICKEKNIYCMLTKFFDGKNFEDIVPSKEDIHNVTESISKLNTLSLDLEVSYDSWGNRNLVKEFEKSPIQDIEIREKLLPIISYLKNIDFSNFSKGVIHGDLQKKHILKKDEKYCLLDYGCVSYDLKIYEISIFLSWFCLEEATWENREEIFNMVLETYLQKHTLNSKEIGMIKPLIAASYAAFLLKSTEYIESGDSNKQTIEWNTKAKNLYFKALEWIEV